MSNLVVREWCNKGMSEQLNWIFTVPSDLPKNEQILKNAVGDVFALNHDASLGFKFHNEDGQYTMVNVLDSTLYFYDMEEFEEDEDGNVVNSWVYFEHDGVAHTFANILNSLLNHGYSECDLVYDQMKQLSDENDLGFVFEKVWDREEYCEKWVAYTSEFSQKAHIGEEVIYAYSVESAKECEKDGFIPKSYELEEVIELYPDDYTRDMAIVCYKK